VQLLYRNTAKAAVTLQDGQIVLDTKVEGEKVQAQLVERGGPFAEKPRVPTPAAEPPPQLISRPAVTQKRKLSFKEQRELNGLPALIEALEKEQASINGELADAGIYASDPGRAALLTDRSSKIDDELLEALGRWEALSTV